MHSETQKMKVLHKTKQDENTTTTQKIKPYTRLNKRKKRQKSKSLQQMKKMQDKKNQTKSTQVVKK